MWTGVYGLSGGDVGLEYPDVIEEAGEMSS